MELREQIAAAISEQFEDVHLAYIPAGKAADAILGLPEIKEALEAKQFAYNEGYQAGLAAGREEEGAWPMPNNWHLQGE